MGRWRPCFSCCTCSFLITYTRIRAEAGLPWVFAPPFVAHGCLLDIGGQVHYNGQDLMGLARLNWFEQDYRSHMMPNQMDAMKYIGDSGGSLRRLSLAIGIATVVALLGSWVGCLHIFYHYGASSAKVNTWYSDQGRVAYSNLQNQLNNHTVTDLPRIWGTLSGAAVTLLLTLMRTRFVWWPLHPIGYVVAQNLHDGLALVPHLHRLGLQGTGPALRRPELLPAGPALLPGPGRRGHGGLVALDPAVSGLQHPRLPDVPDLKSNGAGCHGRFSGSDVSGNVALSASASAYSTACSHDRRSPSAQAEAKAASPNAAFSVRPET